MSEPEINGGKPIDNPLDYRENGDIHPGDPMWAVLMHTLETGQAAYGTQREDGTWDTTFLTPGDRTVPQGSRGCDLRPWWKRLFRRR